MAKKCLECHAEALATAKTCPRCGGGSWPKEAGSGVVQKPRMQPTKAVPPPPPSDPDTLDSLPEAPSEPKLPKVKAPSKKRSAK